MTLYSYTSHTDSLTPSSGGTLVATETGITQANGPNHTFTGLATSFYACKVEVEDSNTGSDEEESENEADQDDSETEDNP